MLVWHAHKAKVRELAFSPDGRWLASTAGDSVFCSVWEAATGELVNGRLGYTARGFPRVGCPRVGFSPLGPLLTSSGAIVAAWDVEHDAPMRCWLYAGEFADPAFAVSPDGVKLVMSKLQQWLVFDNPTTGTPDKEKRVDRRVTIPVAVPTAFAFSSTGAHFAVADGSLELWDPAPGKKPLRFLRDPAGSKATHFAFDRADSRVAVAFGKRVLVWSLADEDPPPVQLRGHAGMVRAVGFLPSGGLLTAGMDGVVRVWDATSGNELRSLDWGIGKIQAATVSADGTLCAAGSDDGHVVVWDTEG